MIMEDISSCVSGEAAIAQYVSYPLHDEEHYEPRSLRSDPRLAKDFNLSRMLGDESAADVAVWESS